MTDSPEELRNKVAGVLVDNIIRGLTSSIEPSEKPVEPGPRDIVFKGTLKQVHKFFYENLWTDGLPIIPPTLENVDEFLRFTDKSPSEIVGILPLEMREATVWNIAVNGVMAGCLPEYMPVLIAVVEAIAEPVFRLGDAGSTPGWEPLIILNGPIIKQLDFNYASGAMRVGKQANTSIGRFLRLFLRNVAGFRITPGGTDKGSIAATFNVVLAENEDAVTSLGWEPFSVDRGFHRGENVITVQSVAYTSPPAYSGGDNPLDHMETLAEVIGRRSAACWVFTGVHYGKWFPLLVISPSVAKVLAKGGWTKDDVRRYLYENAKVSVALLDKLARQCGNSTFDLCEYVDQGIAPKVYCESSDPDRMVPVFMRPDWIGIVVSGDPGRNQNKGYIQNHEQGPPVSKRIKLPWNWESMPKQPGA